MMIKERDGCTSMDFRFTHPKNVLYSIDIKLEGNLMIESNVQLQKANASIAVTDVGIMMLESEVQQLKANELIVVSNGGNVMTERELQ